MNIIAKKFNQIDEKEIVHKFDLMGRNVISFKENQIGFILYKDGSVYKKIKQ